MSAAILAAAAAGLVAVGAFAAGDGMVYYRTPSEVMQQASADTVIRVGGLVVEGSMEESSTASTLVLTDGVREVTVHYPGRFPDVVQEGEGAVVEGRWTPEGVLHGREVLLRHSNEYRPPEEGEA
ncbi:cytochrome c maturation protein CcmE [Aeromicrobium phragmitis]|uniref:cytochrome c maturation protein CcmE n=1 Tax=Aeromicrobium phragmitis TaxID=2478914 RepID=UPI0014094A4A|nr:cytochrome c maturation protein CcmE [Aeromicrobium phragmitis]